MANAAIRLHARRTDDDNWETMISIYRSLLFAPGNNARMVEKCVNAGADAVILDLEDAVAVAQKSGTRDLVVKALALPRRCKAYVRVNALGTEWCFRDLDAITVKGVDGIVLPKTEHANDLITVDWMLRSLEKERGMPEGGIDVIPLIETALGFTHLHAIARANRRIRRIAFGAGDFTLDLGMSWSDGESELLPYRSAFVVESRAAGLEPPIDTALGKLEQPAIFEATARHAMELGFQGKLCIHPSQVKSANKIFRPSDSEVLKARRITEAFDDAKARGLAALTVDGQFVDYPIAHRARAIVARAERISAAEAADLSTSP